MAPVNIIINEGAGLSRGRLLWQGAQGSDRWAELCGQEGKALAKQIRLEFDCEDDSWEMQEVKN